MGDSTSGKTRKLGRDYPNPTCSSETSDSCRFQGKYVMDVDFSETKKPQKYQKPVRDNPRSYTITCFSETDHESKEACFRLMLCSFCKLVCHPDKTQVCERGHLTCNDCFSKVLKCTFEDVDDSGRIKLCLTTVATLKLDMYEYLFGNVNVTLRCKNWTKGCSAELKPEEKRSHNIHCTYRPEIGCPFTDCEVGEMTSKELIEHLIGEHDTALFKADCDMASVNFKMVPEDYAEDYSWTPAIFHLLGYHFLLTILQKDGKMSIWFYRLEKKRPRDNHSIEMKIFHSDKETINKYEYVPRDFSLPSTALKSGMCTHNLDTFMNQIVETREGKNKITLSVKFLDNSHMY